MFKVGDIVQAIGDGLYHNKIRCIKYLVDDDSFGDEFSDKCRCCNYIKIEVG